MVDHWHDVETDDFDVDILHRWRRRSRPCDESPARWESPPRPPARWAAQHPPAPPRPPIASLLRRHFPRLVGRPACHTPRTHSCANAPPPKLVMRDQHQVAHGRWREGHCTDPVPACSRTPAADEGSMSAGSGDDLRSPQLEILHPVFFVPIGIGVQHHPVDNVGPIPAETLRPRTASRLGLRIGAPALQLCHSAHRSARLTGQSPVGSSLEKSTIRPPLLRLCQILHLGDGRRVAASR